MGGELLQPNNSPLYYNSATRGAGGGFSVLCGCSLYGNDTDSSMQHRGTPKNIIAGKQLIIYRIIWIIVYLSIVFNESGR
ncbi:hypothetical protein V1527DRAFT_472979 [Lipomyces starkeyi]